ncbi:14720_t:CDS:2 [Dentiscutata heterogama]|uniref:14720_t:CDS:1 n=1 Tax=Dentiscutata heterogama TaxID=1316150 RepID=A0ACA9KQ74_9GLOM|nr:14720_t:CDS:2 [Dentiscutata heterogama]
MPDYMHEDDMFSLQYGELPRNEEPEYLKLINLTEDEWQLLDDLIILIKLFYEAITIFSGSNYLTFNLIYPTMKLLIKKFKPSNRQTEADYTDLLFGTMEQISDQNPRIKNMNFINDKDIKITTINTVRRLCFEEECHQPLIEEIPRDDEFARSNDLMLDLYSNEKLSSVTKENEVDRYICKPIQRRKYDPLTWWRDNANKFPILSNLAWKYLSVLAMLVPSERLFSDTGLHITVLHNKLHSNMVERMMFLKRNKQHFSIFRPNEL